MATLYITRAALQLRRLAEIEREKHLQACRAILSGPDTPGRRLLIGQLRGESVPQGPESIGAAIVGLSALALERIRDQLATEFSTLITGMEAPYEPATECSAPAGDHAGQQTEPADSARQAERQLDARANRDEMNVCCPDDGSIASQAKRLSILKHVFGSPAPEKIGHLPVEVLRAGLAYLKNYASQETQR